MQGNESIIMKLSSINFAVELDDQNVPEKIMWDASDKPDNLPADTKAISVALWDDRTMNTMRIDLWTKEMTVEEMKRFFINSLGGYAQMILNSTGDEFMANETNALVEKFVEYLKREEEKGQL